MMKITGTYILPTPKEVFWNMITNPEILEKVTPGIEKLTEIEANTYDAVSKVKIGPVRGEFRGKLLLRDVVTYEHCVLELDQQSKMGNVSAEIGMQLLPKGDQQTVVQYTGEAKMSGMLARMGQRIMSGVISTLSKQFFQGIERELAMKQG